MTLHYAAVVAKFISIHRVHLSTRKLVKNLKSSNQFFVVELVW